MKPARVFFFAMLLLGHAVLADVINYQGRVTNDGKPFEGITRFKFFLVEAQGNVAWTSEEITLNVSNGAYAVRLGDSAQAPPISNALLHSGTPVKLRIWIDRKEKGWARLGEDVVLTDEHTPTQATGGSEGAAILAELRAIHALLAGQQAGARQPEPPHIVTVSTAGAPSLGQQDAPLVLVEFTDYQCTFCIKFHHEVFEELKNKYVATGKLRIVSRNLPLPFHPFAEPAAKAAFCANTQGKFWEFRDRLFAANGALSSEALKQAAQDARLDWAALEKCTADNAPVLGLQKDAQDAKLAGIDATPSFVLGKPNGDSVTGLRIVGAQPLAGLEAEIDRQLSAAKQP